MSKILKNQTASPLNIADTGVTIPGSSDYTIPPQDYLLFAASDDVITFVGAGDIVVNDGSSDLSIADGTRLIQGIFPNPVGLIGDTDQTEIGNVDDQLKVYSSVNPVPAQNVIYGHVSFLNGSSKDMDVNGSSTIQNYSASPGAGETWFVDQVRIIIQENGSELTTFGGQGALTNGLRLQAQSLGSVYNIANFQTNADLANLCSVIFAPPDNSGFFDDDDIGFFLFKFETPIELRASDSDFIRFQVRDNLSGLDFLQSGLRYYRIIT